MMDLSCTDPNMPIVKKTDSGMQFQNARVI